MPKRKSNALWLNKQLLASTQLMPKVHCTAYTVLLHSDCTTITSLTYLALMLGKPQLSLLATCPTVTPSFTIAPRHRGLLPKGSRTAYIPSEGDNYSTLIESLLCLVGKDTIKDVVGSMHFKSSLVGTKSLIKISK